jgi:hypothetical protein
MNARASAADPSYLSGFHSMNGLEVNFLPPALRRIPFYAATLVPRRPTGLSLACLNLPAARLRSKYS